MNGTRLLRDIDELMASGMLIESEVSGEGVEGIRIEVGGTDDWACFGEPWAFWRGAECLAGSVVRLR